MFESLEALSLRAKHAEEAYERYSEIIECWKTHERVPGTVPGSKGSCRPKGSAKK